MREGADGYFEGRYMVSNLGRIKSLKYGHHDKEQILLQGNNQVPFQEPRELFLVLLYYFLKDNSIAT